MHMYDSVDTHIDILVADFLFFSDEIKRVRLNAYINEMNVTFNIQINVDFSIDTDWLYFISSRFDFQNVSTAQQQTTTTTTKYK